MVNRAVDISKLINEIESMTSAEGAYLATEVDGDGMLCIKGNASGLMQLATHALTLAQKGSDQKHYHYDEHSSLDDCAKPFVLKYEAEDWEGKKEDV